jgi:hypothetical protein
MFGILSALTISLSFGAIAIWSLIIAIVLFTIIAVAFILYDIKNKDLWTAYAIGTFLSPVIIFCFIIFCVSGFIWLIALFI